MRQELTEILSTACPDCKDKDVNNFYVDMILELIKGECNKARVEIMKEILKAPREMFGWFEFRQDLEEQLAELDKLEDKS